MSVWDAPVDLQQNGTRITRKLLERVLPSDRLVDDVALDLAGRGLVVIDVRRKDSAGIDVAARLEAARVDGLLEDRVGLARPTIREIGVPA